MTKGPGKYDDLCNYVAEQTGINANGGGVFLIVVGGNRGNGFSVIADLATVTNMPNVLEDMAGQIREDLNDK